MDAYVFKDLAADFDVRDLNGKILRMIVREDHHDNGVRVRIVAGVDADGVMYVISAETQHVPTNQR